MISHGHNIPACYDNSENRQNYFLDTLSNVLLIGDTKLFLKAVTRRGGVQLKKEVCRRHSDNNKMTLNICSSCYLSLGGD